MCSANERRRYNVASSLIGWAHTQNDPCVTNHIQQACDSVILSQMLRLSMSTLPLSLVHCANTVLTAYHSYIILHMNLYLQ